MILHDDDHGELHNAMNSGTYVVLAIIGIFSTFGNGFVFWAIYVERRLRTTSNMCILSLAASDFLMGIISLPVYIVLHVLERNVLGDVLCPVVACLDNTLVIVSMWTLLLTSIDRYILILHPGKYNNMMSRRNAVLYIFLVWMYGIVIALLPFLGWNRYGFSGKTCSIMEHDHPYRKGFFFLVEGEIEHSSEEIALIVALGVLAVITIFANLLVIVAFCVDKRLRKTNNYFIISLTLVGFLIGGYSIPLYCVTKWTRSEPIKSICTLCAFLDNSLATISLWTLALTSFDRYYMVINYKVYTRYITRRRAKLGLVLVWLCCMVISAPPLLGWNKYHFNKKTSTCGIKHFVPDEQHREFFLFYFFISFPPPLLTVIFCYFRIFLRAWGVYKRREKRNNNNYLKTMIPPSVAMNNDKDSVVSSNSIKRNDSFLSNLSIPGKLGNKSKKYAYGKLPRQSSTFGGMSIDKTVRATLMVFVLVVVYIICTFPIFAFSILVYFDPGVGKNIPRLTHTFTLFLFFLNSALNPMLYGVFNTNFRGTFSRLLCCQLPKMLRDSHVKYTNMVRRFSSVSSNTTPKNGLVGNCSDGIAGSHNTPLTGTGLRVPDPLSEVLEVQTIEHTNNSSARSDNHSNTNSYHSNANSHHSNANSYHSNASSYHSNASSNNNYSSGRSNCSCKPKIHIHVISSSSNSSSDTEDNTTKRNGPISALL